MPSSDQQTLDIYKSNFTYVVEFDESSDHWWQNTEVKYMYTHKRVYSLYLIHFCNSQVGHVHTLQKFGMWDQINCLEKCFKMCHIFTIYKNPKLLFPFFISCYFVFPSNECPGLCQHSRTRHSLGKIK